MCAGKTRLVRALVVCIFVDSHSVIFQVHFYDVQPWKSLRTSQQLYYKSAIDISVPKKTTLT